MSAHTPGPWVYDETLPGNVYSDDATGSIIATCEGFASAPRPVEEQNANARLIAAAPDLLEACDAPGVTFSEFIMLDQRAQNLARAAIAKAEGRE